MKRTIFVFGLLAAAIFVLFQLSKLSILIFQETNELFLVISGCLFIIVGFLISKLVQGSGKGRRPDPKNSSILSKQEHRILLLLNDGLSNQEIAGKLFISENTVKTHVSNILSKLNARRRTEALKIARDLDLIV